MQAMSLAFTCTAYQPMRSVAKVTGSAFAMSSRSPMSMTAASAPMPGPCSTLGSACAVPDSSRARTSIGSLPTSTVPPVETSVRKWVRGYNTSVSPNA